MLSEWDVIPEDLQLTLTREALKRAADVIAGQAETLADEMAGGAILDRGGPDALRLLAAVLRVTGVGAFEAVQ